MRVDASIFVAAPPERVWEIVTDPRLGPRWNPNVSDVGDISGVPISAGSSWTQNVRILGRQHRISAQVVECDAPSTGVLVMSGMGSPRVTTTVTPAEGGSMLAQIMEISVPAGLGGMAFRLAGPTIQSELNEALRRQRETIESGGD